MAQPAVTDELLPLPLPEAGERWALHVGLFLLTFACVFRLQLEGNDFGAALQFTATLLAILTCHEFGHYFVGRWHGVSISPPYFIPIPLFIGTLGAVIRIRTPISTKNALVDIGAAGPIAGMIVAVPLLFWGMAHSTVGPVPYVAGMHWPGRASLWNLGWALAHGGLDGLVGQLGFAGADVTQWQGDSILTYAAWKVFFHELPPGTDVMLNPVAAAAWFGCMITMFNLLPIGQLDGGHVAYAFLGRRAKWLGNAVHVGLGLLIIFGSIWVAPWLLLTRYLVGLDHPPVTRPEPLSASRYVIALVALALLVLTYIPVPFEIRGTP